MVRRRRPFSRVTHESSDAEFPTDDTTSCLSRGKSIYDVNTPDQNKEHTRIPFLHGSRVGVFLIVLALLLVTICCRSHIDRIRDGLQWQLIQSNGVPLTAGMSGAVRRNRKLESRLGELIRYAKSEAESKGLFTETAASLAKETRKVPKKKDHSALLHIEDIRNGARSQAILCHRDSDCGRGRCAASKCVCAAGYVGTQCTRPIHFIIEKDEDDIEKQRHIVLPLAGMDYFSNSMFGEDQQLYETCLVFYSTKEQESYPSDRNDTAHEQIILYPSEGDVDHDQEKGDTEDSEEGESMVLGAFVKHIFGTDGDTKANTRALERLLTSLRECLSIEIFPGDTRSMLHKYIFENLRAIHAVHILP